MGRQLATHFTLKRFLPLAAACVIHIQLNVAIAGLTYPATPTPHESVLIYDTTSGNLILQYPETSEFGFNTFQFLSASGSFLTDTAAKPSYLNEHQLNRFLPNQIAYIGFGAPQKRSIELYSILPTGLTGEYLAKDLTFGYSCTADSCASFAGLKVVPEPNMAAYGSVLCSLYCLGAYRRMNSFR